MYYASDTQLTKLFSCSLRYTTLCLLLDFENAQKYLSAYLKLLSDLR